MPNAKTANPRRTTLAEVSPEQFRPAAPAGRADAGVLPAATANPRRTVLDVLPDWQPNTD